jgi:hypothetical protein
MFQPWRVKVSHLESLIAEYLEWQGFLVKRNLKVGRRERGGWEMELDVIGLNPKTETIVHYEPSLDALTWGKREPKYAKKFQLARKYILASAKASHSKGRRPIEVRRMGLVAVIPGLTPGAITLRAFGAI